MHENDLLVEILILLYIILDIEFLNPIEWGRNKSRVSDSSTGSNDNAYIFYWLRAGLYKFSTFAQCNVKTIRNS